MNWEAMNWEAIGAVGELVGATAVFVSMIYLAIQVRHNSAEVRSGSYQSAAQTAIQIAQDFADDPARVAVIQAAMESYDSLDRNQQFVAHMMFMELMAHYEAFYYQYREGNLHPEVWGGRERMMIRWFESPGFSFWWDEWHDVWGEGFQRYVAGVRDRESRRT